MLSKERIKELKDKVEQGNKAKELLSEYNYLIDIKEMLNKFKNTCKDCRKINIEVAYNSYIEFKVNMPNFAITQINKILDNEIEYIDNKLKEYK